MEKVKKKGILCILLWLLLIPSLHFVFFSQVLLYDLRSSQPLLVKDHFYNLPIKSLNFHDQLDLIVSADSKIIKIWNKDSVRKNSESIFCCLPVFIKWVRQKKKTIYSWRCVVMSINCICLFYSALQGKLFSSIQPQSDLNDVCMYPNSGTNITFYDCCTFLKLWESRQWSLLFVVTETLMVSWQ